MTKMIRSFLPVGQGAFYLEQFIVDDGKINIVYDCGSDKNPNLVKKLVEDAFNKGDDIDALFVSHMHEDHINGIEFLLRYCNVKKIFFPLLAEEDLKLMLLSHSVNGGANDFAYKFIENPKKAIQSLYPQGQDNVPTKIYGISTERANQANPDMQNTSNDNNNPETIFSGEDLSSIIFDENISDIGKTWEYIPFNFHQTEKCEQLKTALLDEFGIGITADKLLEIWKTNSAAKTQIKKAYKVVNKDLNINSMTLFSGVKDEKIGQYDISSSAKYCYKYLHFHRYYYKEYKTETPAGCLYTGDYKASGDKWQELKNAYSEYIDFIGCLQVPHHGSKHNYNSEFVKELSNCKYFIISAGCNRRHPHASVMKDILKNSGNCPLIVTEDMGSVAIFVTTEF